MSKATDLQNSRPAARELAHRLEGSAQVYDISPEHHAAYWQNQHPELCQKCGHHHKPYIVCPPKLEGLVNRREGGK